MSISGLIAGGGIPVGDQGRVEVTHLAAGVETTVLSESSGSGGIVTGVYVVPNGVGAHIEWAKVTIDGASERTYDYDNPVTAGTLNILDNSPTLVPIPLIDYESSVTIKVRVDTQNTTCYTVYNLKA